MGLDVSALTFDVFGTVVDWRTGVIAEARRLGNLRGVEADWDRLADAVRAAVDVRAIGRLVGLRVVA